MRKPACITCFVLLVSTAILPLTAHGRATQYDRSSADTIELVPQLGNYTNVESMAISPDGTRLVSSQPGRVDLWNLSNGDLLRTMMVKSGCVANMCFSPDGKLLAISARDRRIALCNASTFALIRSLNIASEPTSICFSRAGFTLVVGTEGNSADIWNYRSGKRIRSITTHAWANTGVIAFSDDGTMLACASGDFSPGGACVEIRSSRTGALIRSFRVRGHIYAAAFSPGGDELALSVGNLPGRPIVALYKVKSGAVTRSMRFREFPAVSMAFSRDGKSLTEAGGADFGVWNVSDGNLMQAFGTYGSKVPAAVSSDGRIAVLLSDYSGGMSAYSAIQSSLLREIPCRGHTMNKIVTCRNGQVLISAGRRAIQNSGCGEILVWDVATGACKGSVLWGDNLGDGATLSVSPQGRFVAASTSREAAVWDMTSKRLLLTHRADKFRSIMSVAISSDGALLTIGGRMVSPEVKQSPSGTALKETHLGFMELWSVATRRKIRDFEGVTDIADCLQFGSDNATVISTGIRGGVARWDANTGKLIQTFAGHRGSLYSMNQTGDGRIIAVGANDNTFKVWDTLHPVKPREVPNIGRNSCALAVSSDGNRLVGAREDGGCNIWSVRSGKLLRKLRAEGSAIKALAFVDGGKAVAGLDRAVGIRVWDCETGKLRGTLAPVGGPGDYVDDVSWLTYTPDGRYSGSSNCELYIRWRVRDQIRSGSSYHDTKWSPTKVADSLSGNAIGHTLAVQILPAHTTDTTGGWEPDPATVDGKLFAALSIGGNYKNRPRVEHVLDLIRPAIDTGADVNTQGRWGTSALMFFSEYSSIGDVKRVVEKGASLDLVDAYGSTALLLAARSHNGEVFDYLLARGATLKDERGVSLLTYRDNPALLGSEMANILGRRFQQSTLATGRANSADEPSLGTRFDATDTALALLRLGATTNEIDSFGRTALQDVESVDSDLLKALLARGADINAQCNGTDPAYIEWMQQNSMDLVTIAIEHGADVNYMPSTGWRLLMSASYKGNMVLVRKLLDHTADPNAVSTDGETALYRAISDGHSDVAALLLSRGASTDIDRKYKGYTVLFYAVRRFDVEAVKLLLDHGADISGSGANLLKLAHDIDKADSSGVAALLRKYGAKE